MVYHKLEEAIRKALEGKNFGNNKIIVETTLLGDIIIKDFEEVEIEFKTKIDELSDAIDELQDDLDDLNFNILKQ
jgi:hypothetical protein